MGNTIDDVTRGAIISELYVYPIKSCRGLTLDSASLTATGLAHDRRWMLVNEQGRFLTQRELPQMALIAPELQGEGLVVHAPGMSPLPVRGTATTSVNVTVWKDSCRAFDEGDAAAEWLSQFLNTPARLVRFDESQTRLSNHDWTGEMDAANYFSDGFPILLISRASLADLNSRLSEPLPMNRFRPNIVLDGVEAYAEDRMHQLMDAELKLQIVKPCTRCKITTTDQATGTVQGREPLTTLMTYRRNRQLQGVTFGQNVIIAAGIGTQIRVGQSLQVT